MADSKISVIVPIYKVEQYLDECVGSIVKQTYQNLEIILVDDGSPDGCPQKCDEWAKKDARIRVIHKSNGGLSSARNAGLDIACGQYIGFIDSDDWIASDMYESMLNNLLQADADIAYTASSHVYENGEISTAHLVSGVKLIMNAGEAFKYINLPGYFGIAAWDKLLKREIIGDLRFPEDTKRDEDYGFAYATLDRAHTVVYDSSPKYFYRQTQGTLSNTASTIGTRAAEETAKMVELVRKKYPEQLPYALYGHLLAQMGIWDQVVVSGQTKKPQWRAFCRQLRQFLKESFPMIMKTGELPKNRVIQIRLFLISPTLYGPVFKMFKKLHPHRVG